MRNTKIGYIPNLQAIATLHKNMQSHHDWVKVHAAEFLMEIGYPEGIMETFLKEEQLYGNASPYRIGIWRVLVQIETEKQKRNLWINKIKEAYFDENGNDRIHAVETLAKLKIPIFHEDVKIEDILKDTIDNFSIYKLWNFAHTSDENFLIVQNYLLELSISTVQNSQIRKIAVYALKNMGRLDIGSWFFLVESAFCEYKDITLRANLLNAAIITATQETAKTEKYEQLMKALVLLDGEESKNNIRMLLLDVFAEKGRRDNLDRVYTIFHETVSFECAEACEVLSACAYAIIKIKNRVH